ncbi:MAG: hypothetical protein ACJAW1_001834 [Glaciecola sp.]|jgi:hypothetical protein
MLANFCQSDTLAVLPFSSQAAVAPRSLKVAVANINFFA